MRADPTGASTIQVGAQILCSRLCGQLRLCLQGGHYTQVSAIHLFGQIVKLASLCPWTHTPQHGCDDLNIHELQAKCGLVQLKPLHTQTHTHPQHTQSHTQTWVLFDHVTQGWHHGHTAFQNSLWVVVLKFAYMFPTHVIKF